MTDFRGQTALQVAVQDQNETLVDYLLSHPQLEMGEEQLLCAVREQNVHILDTLLMWQKKCVYYIVLYKHRSQNMYFIKLFDY